MKSVEPKMKVKQTYSQDWPAYNAAQTKEKLEFMRLLNDACNLIQAKPMKRRGRPRINLRDMVYACALKVYCKQSSRRFMSDLMLAREKGYLNSTPHFNSISKYFRDPDVGIALKHLIKVTSLPLAAIEQDFAVDSSGFTGNTYGRWFNVRKFKDSTKQTWNKCHLIVGVKTQIITGVQVTHGYSADIKEFAGLVRETKENFEISEVSADKAYSSRDNLLAVEEAGGTPFIPFRVNASMRSSTRCFAWRRMLRFFREHAEEFYEHYHKRSNVETAFHMIKTKFGTNLLSKSEAGRFNEVLAKALCHNICVVNQEVHELGIQASFCASEIPAQILRVYN